MKMLPTSIAGEASHGGRTVVVGVKMDSHSTELLTWALFKVAQPCDVVLALHVLGNDGIYITIPSNDAFPFLPFFGFHGV